MRITTLRDGSITQPADFMYDPMDQDALAQWLAGRDMARDAALNPDCNVTLLRHEGRTILFDAGSGSGFTATAGDLPDALAAAEVDPGEITHVVFTHGHADHLWGVLDDFEEPFFPNAEHLMGRTEFDFWYDPTTVDTISADRQGMAVGAKRRLDVMADRFTLFEDGEEILPGIAARATHGHTPGHMSFEVRDGGESMMVVGDAILNHHLSFDHPDWPLGADADRTMAAATRAALMDQLAGDQMLMIGFHLPDGGLGRVERAGGAFRFVPA